MKILLVDDDALFRRSLSLSLSEEHQVIEAESGREGIELFKKNTPQIVFLDYTMPELNGIDVLRSMRALRPDAIIIMLTAMDTLSIVVESMRLGAFDYMIKPVNFDELHLIVNRCAEAMTIRQELRQRRQIQISENERYELIGESEALTKIRDTISVVAPSDSVVLIEGETGTGKEIIARSIHQMSKRSEQPFIAVNCGAIPKELFEAEFFGYKKGAFTGAQKDMEGKFALAHKGTLLLDEIGEMPMDMQAKLLRVLDRREFYPVGSESLVQVDVRILASTNRNLTEMVKNGLFRQDLFYRLNVYRLLVPALRSRREDILPLANYYLLLYSQRMGKDIRTLDSDAADFLIRYHWPGNIRELKNAIERVVLTCNTSYAERKHFTWLSDADTSFRSTQSLEAIDIPEGGLDFEELEKKIIMKALEVSGGNKSKAAKLLRMSVQTFYYRFEKFGLTQESA